MAESTQFTVAMIDERFGPTNHLRRAASSTGVQLAEGLRMLTPKHRVSYYQGAYASNVEVDYFLQRALDLSFVNSETYE